LPPKTETTDDKHGTTMKNHGGRNG
jgi:hypothetical protein